MPVRYDALCPIHSTSGLFLPTPTVSYPFLLVFVLTHDQHPTAAFLIFFSWWLFSFHLPRDR